MKSIYWCFKGLRPSQHQISPHYKNGGNEERDRRLQVVKLLTALSYCVGGSSLFAVFLQLIVIDGIVFYSKRFGSAHKPFFTDRQVIDGCAWWVRDLLGWSVGPSAGSPTITNTTHQHLLLSDACQRKNLVQRKMQTKKSESFQNSFLFVLSFCSYFVKSVSFQKSCFIVFLFSASLSSSSR